MPRGIAALLAAAALAGCGGSDDTGPASTDRFDADRAMALVEGQVEVGQRPAGSPQLRGLAEELRPHPTGRRVRAVPEHGPQRGLRNIVGVIPGRAPAILIGAHYDTEWHPEGFVGANDGAAGTAGVIELARIAPPELPADHREIRFVLFDGRRSRRDARRRTFSSARCVDRAPTRPPTRARSAR